MTDRTKMIETILKHCTEYTEKELNEMDLIDIRKIWAWLYFSKKLYK